MKVPREVFKNTPGECQWLNDAHLSHLEIPPFSSFTLYGGDNDPLRIDFYTQEKPEYNQHPNYVLVRGVDGEWFEGEQE